MTIVRGYTRSGSDQTQRGYLAPKHTITGQPRETAPFYLGLDKVSEFVDNPKNYTRSGSDQTQRGYLPQQPTITGQPRETAPFYLGLDKVSEFMTIVRGYTRSGSDQTQRGYLAPKHTITGSDQTQRGYLPQQPTITGQLRQTAHHFLGLDEVSEYIDNPKNYMRSGSNHTAKSEELLCVDNPWL
ncbi:hypothetical protein BDZ97DRAFT_1770706 [Flammula alnicola]|nr:hypothetical protein BDZ97DRAFT_1770706 [Flammula alnicola]